MGEGGQETDDQACLLVLLSSPPTSCTKSSTALFAFLSPPHPYSPLAPPCAALRLSCLGLLLPILARAVVLFLERFTQTASPARLIEPRTEDVREVGRGARLNHHRGVDWSPSASCALHIPPVVAVGIPLFGVASF